MENININKILNREEIIIKLKDILNHFEKNKYDIVYVAGCFSIKWNPTDKSLGGSEQAIVNLSELTSEC